MKLSLENIGMIGSASVEMNGITVIAGENNTGKSTVGRALFSVFNSLYNIDKQIQDERAVSISSLLALMYRNTTNQFIRQFDTREIAEKILEIPDIYKMDQETLRKDILQIIRHSKNFAECVTSPYIDEMLMRIADVLSVPDIDIMKMIFNKKLDAEFGMQINHIYSDKEGLIQLWIQNQPVSIKVKENNVTELAHWINLDTEVVYIDDPFILDNYITENFRINSSDSDHKDHLKKKLFHTGQNNSNIVDEIIVNNKFNIIYRKIAEACSGDIVNHKRSEFGYKADDTEKILSIKNLSTGLKTFIILKTLLQNGTIKYHGAIILDEPEIHLHPEWQLLFAEIIVLLHREFKIHILLNTHSPYFLNAIEVYAAKYAVADKCKYYLTRVEGKFSFVDDVTNHIEAVYEKLAGPFQKLENERNKND